jgi:methenyltetrahydrofolate cyclohydrolase
MKLIELKTIDFLNEVDSKSPAPGGGSVAALLSSLGISLIRMVGHLTIEKKKFKQLPDDIQTLFFRKTNELLNLKDELIQLIDADTEAFNRIMEAYNMPKATEADLSERLKAIEQATIEAITVPQTVANLSLRAIEDLDIIMTYGNPMTISDIGVGVLSLCAGIEGACLNMLINLSGLSLEKDIKMYKHEVTLILNQMQTIKEKIRSVIYQKLSL